MGTDSQFKPPPDAPIFEPSDEEFKDPLAYIAKIRPIAEKFGICKIRPPSHWQPPFAVDVDNFKFTPRIQRLNELEAHTRIKLNFLDKLAKFWELQGCSLKIPKIEKRSLDFYTLHKCVQEEGGYAKCCQDKIWAKIATKMCYPAGKNIGTMLRIHYERILQPYDIFHDDMKIPQDVAFADELNCTKWENDKDYIPHEIQSRQMMSTSNERYSRRSKRRYPPVSKQEQDPDMNYGANIKNEGTDAGVKKENLVPVDSKRDPYEYHDDDFSPHPPFTSQVEKYYCNNCGRGDSEEQLLLCDGCDDSYHTFCLRPPLSEVPKGDWRCPKCVAVEVVKPKESFGFEQAQKEYTLQSFGEMADNFKSDYFNMPVHMVPCSVVEQEFWRIVSAIDEDVTVEYGADLHTMDHGSGFPVTGSSKLLDCDKGYAESEWNLNNLPDLKNSILSHINADINGMKIPWAYVGMCFSAFCWHTEDHWSYSINYLHWGEPKTWYGVSEKNADKFESAMKAAAPELFHNQPDLLHQLVTIMNPGSLMKYGIPVCRADQHAGEFMVTFPRAYHTGFNQGYNFAEAVNFCPTDWLPIGRQCIIHYGKLHRYCVFSHDELICKMAADPDSLDLELAAATYQDMLKMVESEKELRKALRAKGVTKAEREAFELLPDDERQCEFCKTTCFLSAVTCNVCKEPEKLVCLQHVQEICSCNAENLCLRYRYTLDELPLMLQKLKVRAESYDKWAHTVKKALEAPEGSKSDIDDLRDLLEEATEMNFESCELLKTLEVAVQEAEKCSNVAQQLVSKKVRTRNRQSGETSKYAARLTLEELLLFHEQIMLLSCEIKESAPIKELVSNVQEFQAEAKILLEDDEMPKSSNLEKTLEMGVTLDIDLPEIAILKKRSQQAQWLEDVSSTLEDPQEVTLDSLRDLLDSGINLPPHSSVEKAMAELQDLLTIGERTEEKAKVYLQAKPRQSLVVLDELISEANRIPVFLPNVMTLEESVKKGKEWSAKVKTLQSGQHPYLEVLENLVNKGKPIPARLEQLPELEERVSAAKNWKEKTSRTYLKKNSLYNLFEVLCPRTDIGQYHGCKVKKRKFLNKDSSREDKDGSYSSISSSMEIKFDEAKDTASFAKLFKEGEKLEMSAMKELRVRNTQKRCDENNSDANKYCICRKGISGFMLQCELCKDWFHASCVPLPKSVNAKKVPISGKESASSTNSRDLKFLCPLCCRSRRPRLETILSLLMVLQKLPVKLPESDALQCLTERAMSWQDRARQALATEELAAALAKLSVLSQQIVEQAAREKMVNGNKLGRSLTKSRSFVSSDFTDDTCSNGEASQDENRMNSESDSDSMSEGSSPKFSSLEHAYSTASKPSPISEVSTSSPRKHLRKSVLVPRNSDAPVLEMSEKTKRQLEDLMMEGDLLEVSLDETQHIWRILQATKPSRSDEPSFADLLAMDVDFKKDSERKVLKRKHNDNIEKPKNKSKQLPKSSDDRFIKKKKLKSSSKDSSRSYSSKSERSNKGSKQKKAKIEKRIDEDEDEESEDEEDSCSSNPCLKPSGEEVNWVQCDGGCDLWFHLLCVGLSKSDVSESEDYICDSCGKEDRMNCSDDDDDSSSFRTT